MLTPLWDHWTRPSLYRVSITEEGSAGSTLWHAASCQDWSGAICHSRADCYSGKTVSWFWHKWMMLWQLKLFANNSRIQNYNMSKLSFDIWFIPECQPGSNLLSTAHAICTVVGKMEAACICAVHHKWAFQRIVRCSLETLWYIIDVDLGPIECSVPVCLQLQFPCPQVFIWKRRVEGWERNLARTLVPQWLHHCVE